MPRLDQRAIRVEGRQLQEGLREGRQCGVELSREEVEILLETDLSNPKGAWKTM